MTVKPLLILDQYFRKLEELFRPAAFESLQDLCDVHGGQNWPMERARIDGLLPEATFYVASRPEMSAADLSRASKLRATIEVSGAFRSGIDYEACFRKGVEVLSCSPGFRNAVAEMALAMVLSAGRGLVFEHEAFRNNAEHWLDDREATDFSVYGQTVGFIGYGQIARETHRLMAPFGPKVFAYDPYVSDAPDTVSSCELETLVEQCRVVIVAAVPSEETRGLLSAELIDRLQTGALVVLISRAWCADFPALMAAAEAGRICVATDVFPDEPLAVSDPLRRARNVILSPHRAAAVPGGRQLIGDMIVHDIKAILDGRSERQLKVADPEQVQGLVNAQNSMKAMPNT